jgi:hypothetical protein
MNNNSGNRNNKTQKKKYVRRTAEQILANARNLFEFESRIEVEKIIVAEAKLKALAEGAKLASQRYA